MKAFFTAVLFYTRLPIGHWVTVPDHYFKNVVRYWPLAGWITAPIMALVLAGSSLVLPYHSAVVLAIISRVLITGGLHEDGLADFADGFGGGTTPERILAIMKDSHIGTYGVLALIGYFLLLFNLLSALPLGFALIAILAGDPLCKGLAAYIALKLPYVRTASESKFHIVLSTFNFKDYRYSLVFALMPAIILLPFAAYLITVPLVLLFYGLTSFMRTKIGGYTGDCAGALFLLLELFFYLCMVLLEGS